MLVLVLIVVVVVLLVVSQDVVVLNKCDLLAAAPGGGLGALADMEDELARRAPGVRVVRARYGEVSTGGKPAGTHASGCCPGADVAR